MEYTIKTKCGELKGVLLKNGTVQYKGIRYATAGRFEYPVEVTAWNGVYDATSYGACAYQARAFWDEAQVPKKAFYYNEFRRGEQYTYSEDCLFLNIFTPQKAEQRLPVIVYIHGGSFTGGCGFEKHFDSPIWPTKGVIGVTINYRLGPWGFAVLKGTKDSQGCVGNYGLYDQVAAINWVKHNIEAFGGDPDNITVMGQSAGAMSVQLLCLSPLTKGLFSKAVMCSGGGVSKMLSAKKPKKQYGFWQGIMKKCGATTVEQFKTVAPEALYKAWQENKKMSMGGGCSPCIDGRLVVEASHKILKKGAQHQIPYLIGTTAQDVVPPILYTMAKKWCKAQKTPAYQWFFERNLPGDSHGAWHSSDLWYWFGTLDNCWRPFTQRDYTISLEMVDSLIAFAKTGNPCTNEASWALNSDKVICFGDEKTELKKPSMKKLWVTMFTNKAPGE